MFLDLDHHLTSSRCFWDLDHHELSEYSLFSMENICLSDLSSPPEVIREVKLGRI